MEKQDQETRSYIAVYKQDQETSAITAILLDFGAIGISLPNNKDLSSAREEVRKFVVAYGTSVSNGLCEWPESTAQQEVMNTYSRILGYLHSIVTVNPDGSVANERLDQSGNIIPEPKISATTAHVIPFPRTKSSRAKKKT